MKNFTLTYKYYIGYKEHIGISIFSNIHSKDGLYDLILCINEIFEHIRDIQDFEILSLREDETE